MAKIDLKKSAGFSLILENNELTSTDFVPKTMLVADIEDVRNQLLNQDLSYPETFYNKYLSLDQDNILDQKGLRLNTYVIPSNLAGIEYVKTRANRLKTHPKILEVLYGGGVIILQRYTEDGNTDVILTKIKRDQKIIVPPDFAMVLVNTRQSTLVVSEIYQKDLRHSASLDEMKGMNYYVIRKNAKQEIVRNPNYRDDSKYRRVKWEDLATKHSITLRTPIIKQILRKYEKFSWLFKENSPEI
ncbi:hypothetical protein KC622_00325 [Candidatus Dojkabacteria bacterium]|uniref:glucose-6-phosphate isomerase n=1 Tax=Candidatus Dojkabacteria bacterium TaxID=2099670 RepID=A0A955HXB5_9BACT|nr:hypothetical protein [Candidatus Dojkabacteria bacterium]MCB9790588.1 hypothetical protein [Candidatus Nomurabacteria bacterium]